jgi:hypothetical protein
MVRSLERQAMLAETAAGHLNCFLTKTREPRFRETLDTACLKNFIVSSAVSTHHVAKDGVSKRLGQLRGIFRSSMPEGNLLRIGWGSLGFGTTCSYSDDLKWTISFRTFTKN